MLKRVFAVALVVGIVSCGMVFAQDKGKGLNTDSEKLSYTLGMDIGKFLKDVPRDIDFEIFIQGIKDSFNGDTTILTEEEATQIKQEFIKEIQAENMKKMEEIAAKNKKDGETFLAENKKKAGVKTTKSGLQYVILKEGNGPTPKIDDKVKVHYRGTLIDGTEFDSSYARGEPVTFQLNSVITGWTEGLQLMKVGGKYKLFVPSELGYGERGAGTQIGPDTVLIFEVELLGIEK